MLYRDKYRVESARRAGWDYANAAWYFVTICAHNHHHYFGKIVGRDAIHRVSVTPDTINTNAMLGDAIHGDAILGDAMNRVPAVVLSDIGQIAERIWQEIPQQFPIVHLDEFVVMPNHVHGIIQIVADRRDAIYRVSQTQENSTQKNAMSDAMSEDAMNQDAMNRVSTAEKL